MKYLSTRGAGPVSLDDALRLGIASDGGLFLPEQLPTFSISEFDGAETIPEVARVLLQPFFDGSALADELEAILAETYGFPIPATPLPTNDHERIFSPRPKDFARNTIATDSKRTAPMNI